jgi:hypothetical protein
MPAIVLYASHELDVLPEDPFDIAISMKMLMDCNAKLMKICRYKGSSMRSLQLRRHQRLALFGNRIRCCLEASIRTMLEMDAG